MTHQILLVFAFVFFIIGVLYPWPSSNPPAPFYLRFNVVSAGLACWVATEIFK